MPSSSIAAKTPTGNVATPRGGLWVVTSDHLDAGCFSPRRLMPMIPTARRITVGSSMSCNTQLQVVATLME